MGKYTANGKRERSRVPEELSASREGVRPEIVLDKLRRVLRAAAHASMRAAPLAGLSGAQLRMLVALGEAPGASVSELARTLGIHSSTASNLLDRLVTDHLVERARTAQDRRVVQLQLSARGATLAAAAPPAAASPLDAALAGMPASELQRLDRALSQLLARTEACAAALRGARG